MVEQASNPADAHQPPDRDKPFHTGEVLESEFKLIHGNNRWDPAELKDDAIRAGLIEQAIAGLPHDSDKAEKLAIHAWSVHCLPDPGQSALCLSGGGIRSAAFALGILQGLARRGLLQQFHYLSTVSGGGYIGSWLTAWRQRAGIMKAVAGLRTRNFGEFDEPLPLQRMRFNQNFLTPKVGLGSADTWTALAAVIRNLLLNWLVFLPLFLGILLLPQIIQAFLIGMQQGEAGSSLVALFGEYVWVPQIDGEHLTQLKDILKWSAWRSWADSAAVILIVIGFAVSAYNRPAGGRSALTQTRFLSRILAPVLAGVLLLTGATASWLPRLIRPTADLARWAFLGAAIYLSARIIAAIWAAPRERDTQRFDNWAFLLELIGWAAAGICTGALVGAGAQLFKVWMADREQIRLTQMFVVCGPPWILLSFLLGETIYVGATSRLPYSEQDGEWLARAAGWFGAVAVFYFVFAWIDLFGWGTIQAGGKVVKSAVAGVGILAILGALAPMTRATAAATAKDKTPLTGLVTLLSILFILGASAALAELDRLFIERLGELLPHLNLANWVLGAFSDAAFLAGVCVVLIVVSSTISMLVNVNGFSLHALYRNRLVKTFLGASNMGPSEARDRFDGFSSRDNIPLAKLVDRILAEKNQEGQGEISGFLYPVLNISLNVLATHNLAWQERKAEPFICTPLFTGADRVCYRPSARCAVGPWQGDDPTNRSISLGTAMAISGAAVSPNWGYHSSPITSFLMMLANVRLGWWLGNPRHKSSWRHRGPSASWRLFLEEALGQTDDREPWVYLSDGGHFENLGIYEMVRRRCRTIVVSDAGADPNCTLEDLGNAVRKVAIDLGVKIEFERIHVRKRSDAAAAGVYCAVGSIFYPEGKPGIIVYFKPGFYGISEPADVRAYAAANAKFPHESTLNQWFGESQFESYRSLGAYVIEEICGRLAANLTLNDFAAAARDYLKRFEDEHVGDGVTIVDIRRPIQLAAAD